MCVCIYMYMYIYIYVYVYHIYYAHTGTQTHSHLEVVDLSGVLAFELLKLARHFSARCHQLADLILDLLVA